MSREFIDAIASGNNLEAEDEFKNSISSKVGDALEFRRKEISQTFAGNNELVEEDSKPYVKQKPDGTWCVYDAEGNIVSEHESEDEAKAALSNKKEDDEVDEAWVSIGKAAGPAPSSQRRATADDPKPYIRTKPMDQPYLLPSAPKSMRSKLGRVNKEYMKKHPKAAASRAK